MTLCEGPGSGVPPRTCLGRTGPESFLRKAKARCPLTFFCKMCRPRVLSVNFVRPFGGLHTRIPETIADPQRMLAASNNTSTIADE